MFMAPHDFQVIAQVRGPALETYGNYIAHFGFSAIYTFKPKPFAIDELNPLQRIPPNGKSIDGALFRGHFERGGDNIAADTSFQAEQIIHYQQFKTGAETTPRGGLQYICFGSRDAAYLAHVITAPPDFDQILQIQLGPLSGISDEDLRSGVLVTINDRRNDVTTALRDRESVTGSVETGEPGRTEPMELTVVREVYLETADLAGGR
jgi:hypothetical protein